MSMLENKSITDLRSIAQSFGIPNIFQKDITQLKQLISQKQLDMLPKPRFDVPMPAYDARLMTAPPNKTGDKQEIESILTPYIARGLLVTFDDERIYFRCGKKTDEMTLRAPLRHVLRVAKVVME